MKFGQYLEQHAFGPWRNEYIQYNQLKYFLKEQQYKPNGGWTVQDENYFAEKLMIDELNKVNGFIYLKTKQIRSIMQQESEQEIRQKITDLIQFVRLNAIGFQKILKSHDKHTHYNLQSSIRFRDVPNQFSTHEINLNEILYSYPAITEIASAPPPASALEKVITTKYWIHPDNLTEVQALLLFYLPISDDNTSSTVYFDNPHQFPLYSNVLERNESAETIRAKWYGHMSNTTDIYFERKIHHESWLHNKGLFVKDRFSLPLPQVGNYLAHGRTQTNPQLAASIYQSMHQKNLKSTLRCYHHRATYHQGHSPFRVSLDTKVTFMKEMSAHWHRQDIGEQYPFSHLPRDQVYLFPYAILETKFVNTAGTDECAPEWLSQLVESQLVYEVPYFSKYLHGASYFFREQLPMLPWWLSEMNVDIRRKPSYAALSTPSTEQQHQQQHKCTVIEPDYTPDYYAVAAPGITLPKRSKEYDEDQDDKKLISDNVHSKYASSCTMIEDSHMQFAPTNKRREMPSQPEQEPTSSAYDKFLNSAIMIKIKHITQDSGDDDDVVMKKDANYIGMLPWLYRKLMRDKTLYALPPQPKQQIMPKKGKLNNNKKIEPKIFFANERTFISWLQFSALLLSVSLGLINFGDHISKGSGAFFIVVAVVLAGYAQLRFQYRAWQIRFRSESRFDDIYGPAVLCFVLVIALVVNLGLRVNQPLPTHPSPFGYNTTDANSTTALHDNHPHFPNGTMLNKHGKLVSIEEEDEEDINEA